jgi:hypothetical protein
MKTGIKKQILAILLLSIVYIAWASEFIYKSSYFGIDGLRYFSLFDDAMISMRYAWHLANGYGLVWNIGERVEGITNPLWTLWMSLANILLEKKFAVLSIQISGIFILLGIAALTYVIAAQISRDRTTPNNFWVPALTLTSVFLYYPLSFWTLLGMEVGLLSLLLLTSVYIVLKDGGNQRILPLLLVIFGLATLTRPDALIPIFVVISYRIYMLFTSKTNLPPKSGDKFRTVFMEVSILIVLVFLPIALRYFYYGELLPNTYTLKMTGLSLSDRLANGCGFIKPYLLSVTPLFIIIIVDYTTFKSNKKILLLALVIASIVYQIWIGGDPWAYWRMMAPLIPLLFVLGISSLFNLANKYSMITQINSWKINFPYFVIVFIGILSVYVIPNFKFLSEQFFLKPALYTDTFSSYTNMAIATNEILTNNATVAVFGAGTMPYYSNFKAIDMLGKSDKKIARLPPDISGAIAWSGMQSVPGHNKYDLHYSIVELKPTFIQNYIFGRDNLTEYASQNYIQVPYKGFELLLLKDSKDVLWEKLKSFP